MWALAIEYTKNKKSFTETKTFPSDIDADNYQLALLKSGAKIIDACLSRKRTSGAV